MRNTARPSSCFSDQDEQLPRDLALIEFTPPQTVFVREVLSEHVPRHYRPISGQKVLLIELVLPGLRPFHDNSSVNSKYRQRKWCVRLFPGKHLSDKKHRDMPYSNFTRSHVDGSIGDNTLVTSNGRWFRVNHTQQPKNGEIWYKISPHRAQISVLIESKYAWSNLKDNTDTVEFPKSPVDSIFISEESLNSSTLGETKTHYYYWDSGKLRYPVDVKQSRLVVADNRLVCYFCLEGTSKKQSVWTKEELRELESISKSWTTKTGEFAGDTKLISATHTKDDKNECLLINPGLTENASGYYQVIIERSPGESLGLTLVEKPFAPAFHSVENNYTTKGLFIKSMCPGGAAEKTGKLSVGDQLIAINSVSVLLQPPQLIMNRQDDETNTYTRKGSEPHSIGEHSSYAHSSAETKGKVGSTLPRSSSAYPFAIRLLQQAIGPVCLSMRRLKPLRSYLYPAEDSAPTTKCTDAEKIIKETEMWSEGDVSEISSLHTSKYEQLKSSSNAGAQVLMMLATIKMDRAKMGEAILVNRNPKTNEDYTTMTEGESLATKHRQLQHIDRSFNERTEIDTETLQTMTQKSMVESYAQPNDPFENIDEYFEWMENDLDPKTPLSNSAPNSVVHKVAKVKVTTKTIKKSKSAHARCSADSSNRNSKRRKETLDLDTILTSHKPNKFKLNIDAPTLKGPQETYRKLIRVEPGAVSREHKSGEKSRRNCKKERCNNMSLKQEFEDAPKCRTKLEERLNTLMDYFFNEKKSIDGAALDSSIDSNEVDAFHDILEHLSEEEWQLLLRVVTQPDQFDFNIDDTLTTKSPVEK